MFCGKFFSEVLEIIPLVDGICSGEGLGGAGASREILAGSLLQHSHKQLQRPAYRVSRVSASSKDDEVLANVHLCLEFLIVAMDIVFKGNLVFSASRKVIDVEYFWNSLSLVLRAFEVVQSDLGALCRSARRMVCDDRTNDWSNKKKLPDDGSIGRILRMVASSSLSARNILSQANSCMESSFFSYST